MELDNKKIINYYCPPKCPLCGKEYQGDGVIEKTKLEGQRYIEYHRCATKDCRHIFDIDRTREMGAFDE